MFGKLKEIAFQTTYPLLQRGLYSLRPHKKSSGDFISIVYKPDAIGDFVLASQAIRHLLALPGTWWMVLSPAVIPLAQKMFPDVNLLALDVGDGRGSMLAGIRKMKSMLSFARKVQVDRLVCLKHALTGMDHCMIRWLNPRRSYALTGSPLVHKEWSAFRRFPFTNTRPYPEEFHTVPRELLAHHHLLDLVGVECASCVDLLPSIPSDRGSKQPKDQLLVFPTTRSELRNYPSDQLVAAIQSANLPPGTRILFSGAPAERANARTIAQRLGLPPTAWVDTPKITDALQLIQESRCVLAMESAPAHLALACEKPGVFLLGGGHYGYFAPWTRHAGQRWLSFRTSCYGCNWRCHLDQPICVSSISPEIIGLAIRQAWYHTSTRIPHPSIL